MGPSPNRWRGSSTRPEPGQAARQRDVCVQMAGLCGSKGASSRRCRGAWAAPAVGRDPPWHFKLWTSPLEPSALQAPARLGHQACARLSGLVHPVLLCRGSVLQSPQVCLPGTITAHSNTIRQCPSIQIHLLKFGCLNGSSLPREMEQDDLFSGPQF